MLLKKEEEEEEEEEENKNKNKNNNKKQKQKQKLKKGTFIFKTLKRGLNPYSKLSLSWTFVVPGAYHAY